MKAIIFGGTGYIGSHVAEQLVMAGHDVTAAVRPSGDTAFLKSLGIPIVEAGLTDADSIARAVSGFEVVYNCTARPRLHQTLEGCREVEVKLTRKLVEGAAKAGARRFLQISTALVYGLSLPPKPVDETYRGEPEYPFQRAYLEREEVVREAAARAGLEAVILRPAGSIGLRDKKSFFSIMYNFHRRNMYPLVGGGKARFSAEDARDIGRAFVWLGELKGAGGQTYNLRAFEVSHLELKRAIDVARGIKAREIYVPGAAAMIAGAFFEWITPYSREPALTRFAARALTTEMLFSDRKLRDTGFSTIYGFKQAVGEAAADQESRRMS